MSKELKVVTYNLWCVWKHPKHLNSFMNRAGMVYEKIKKEQPDIIGFQEVIAPQLEYLEAVMPDYLFLGQGRQEDFKGEGLYMAIKKSTLMLCGLDIFWISPEPYVPASRFETQSPYPRICIDVLVRHKETGKMLRVYDVHLDHIDDTDAKEQGMEVVLEKIAEDQKKLPAEVILLGDFNEQPDGRATRFLNNFEKIKLTDITSEIPYTWHGFGSPDPNLKIDYIFVSEKLVDTVQKVEVWDDYQNGLYFSDHFPVSAVFNLE